MLINTGSTAMASTNRLLTTPAYQIGDQTAYALEGSIFVAGAAIQWLRDKLGLVSASEESEAMAKAANPDHGVVVVPGFTGLGAPYWRPDARGLISGMTLDTTAADLVRATLESIAYQTRDLTQAMARDGAPTPAAIRIDGGMSQNAWFAQFLADMVAAPVERPESHETTALGAACLAGITTGVFADTADFAQRWQAAARFEPVMADERRTALYAGWKKAVERALL
jgi:glycerol kinase